MRNKKQILKAVLNGEEISVVNFIDNTYGNWEIIFVPYKEGYIKHIQGADNWRYCPVCGQPQNLSNPCDCDEDDMDSYQFLNKDDVFKYLVRRKSDHEIRCE
jgi:hypothetical protein